MRKRRLSLECLERRLVLSGVGQPDAEQLGPDWQSVIVSLKDDVADPGAAAAALMQSAGGQVGRVYQHALKGFSAQLPAAAVEGLSHNPMVKTIEPDAIVQAAAQTMPTGVMRIGTLANTTASIDGVDERVDVDVAILDTGIDTSHPDLDVVGGVNFSRGPSSKYTDGNGHGTHVAGTVAALDNDFGVVGVAPGARLWSVRVLDNAGFGSVSAMIAGIDWVTAHADTIEVANMSIEGTGYSSLLHGAIQASVDAGVLYTVAAGNSWRNIYGRDGVFGTSDDTIPAVFPEVATISAFTDGDGAPGGLADVVDNFTWDDYDDSVTEFSNFDGSNGADPFAAYNAQYNTSYGYLVDSDGGGIDLALPGVNILSTYRGGAYTEMDGTSMASPHAAGLAALYIAEQGVSPTSAGDVFAIRQALIENGIEMRDPDLGLVPRDAHIVLGFVSGYDERDALPENLGWAGSTEQVDASPTVSITDPVDGEPVAGLVTITATANDDDGVTQVEFYRNDPDLPGALPILLGIGEETSDGWSFSWDTTTLTDNTYTVTAVATDTASQTGSDSISVAVDNVDDSPIVAITAPTAGASVSGTVAITADASDDRGITQVEFFRDDLSVEGDGPVAIGTDYEGGDGWSILWDATQLGGGYAITASATDSGGNTVESDPVSVTVVPVSEASNHVADLDGDTRTIGKSGKWQAFVSVRVFDQTDQSVSGASVTGTWSGAWSGTTFGLTGSDGWVTLSTELMLTGSSVTFEVDTVVQGDTPYNPGLNSDADGDSDGTTIAITNPYGSSLNGVTTAEALDLDALIGYLVSVNNKRESAKKDVDAQAAAVDLLMAYGL